MTFAKNEAIAILAGSLNSSGRFSSTVSQNGVRSCSDREIQVSTIDHISLHRTSVAMYEYLHGKSRYVEEVK